MTTYVPYHASNLIRVNGESDAQYAVRIGGAGGKTIGLELLLNRERAALLCELLEAAREAGREESVQC